jgi:two-component system response regulator AtoC
MAASGTIFLDEIGELSLSSQTKLLHVLQDRKFERVGGDGCPIAMEARIIGATNRNLERMVVDGTFRNDLFFRLRVLSIRTPSLRERPQDIPMLAHHFALLAGTDAGRQVVGVSAEALDRFQRYEWPGNIRELENLIHHAVAMGEGDEITVRDLPADFMIGSSSPSKTIPRFYDAIDALVRELCIQAFTRSKGNCLAAAQLLGLHRSSLYRLLHRHGLGELLRPED